MVDYVRELYGFSKELLERAGDFETQGSYVWQFSGTIKTFIFNFKIKSFFWVCH